MIHYISKFGLAYVVVTNNPPISVDYNNKDLGFFFFLLMLHIYSVALFGTQAKEAAPIWGIPLVGEENETLLWKFLFWSGMCQFLIFHCLEQVTWPNLTRTRQECLILYQRRAMSILSNNDTHSHVSDFISLLSGITLVLLVAMFPVTLIWGNETSSVQRNDRPENVIAALISVFRAAALVPETILYDSELIRECHDQICILDYFGCSIENGENTSE